MSTKQVRGGRELWRKSKARQQGKAMTVPRSGDSGKEEGGVGILGKKRLVAGILEGKECYLLGGLIIPPIL